MRTVKRMAAAFIGGLGIGAIIGLILIGLREVFGVQKMLWILFFAMAAYLIIFFTIEGRRERKCYQKHASEQTLKATKRTRDRLN